MSQFCLSKIDFKFPVAKFADEDGLLLIGGFLNPEKILEAYCKGIFPWFKEGEPVLWWSPDPRFVLFPDELHVSRSMKKIFKQNKFEFRINTAFNAVIAACKKISRKGQKNTWITDDMETVYTDLHKMGYSHSAEAWMDDQLVGGMYGIKIGDVFYGESMFSKISNASKFAFISYVQHLQKKGVQLIDCQVYTQHVESLGGRLIEREKFIALLEQLAQKSKPAT